MRTTTLRHSCDANCAKNLRRKDNTVNTENNRRRIKIEGDWAEAARKAVNKPVPPEGVPPPPGKGTVPQRKKKIPAKPKPEKPQGE